MKKGVSRCQHSCHFIILHSAFLYYALLGVYVASFFTQADLVVCSKTVQLVRGSRKPKWEKPKLDEAFSKTALEVPPRNCGV
jgi:hypothetical protein